MLCEVGGVESGIFKREGVEALELGVGFGLVVHRAWPAGRADCSQTDSDSPGPGPSRTQEQTRPRRGHPASELETQ